MRIASVLLALAMAFSAAVRPAAAADPEVITITTTTAAVAGSALQLMQDCIDEVFNARGKGWFKFEHFHSSALFKQDAEYAAVLSGDVDMSFVSPSWYSDNGIGWFGMFDSGFIYDSFAHQQAVFNIDGEVGGEVSDRVYKATNGGIKVLGACALGTRTLWLRSKNMIINTPADMAPIKLRMSNSAAWLLLGRSLGAQPTPLDGNETYLALQTGAIDSQENAIMAAYNGKFQEVCETIARTDHLIAGNTVAFHGGTWNRMTPEQQALFKQLIQEAIALQVSRVEKEEKRIMEELAGKGMIMQYPDRAVFKKHVQDFYLNDPFSDSWDKALLEKVNALSR